MSFEPGSRVERMQALNVKAAHIAAMADISPASISRWINGQIDLSPYEVTKIDQLLSDLERLVDRAAGIPIDFKNIVRMKELIDALHREKTGSPLEPPTAEDWQLFTDALTQDLPSLALKMNLSNAELLVRLGEMSRRMDFAIRELREVSQGRRDLAAANREAFESQRLSNRK